MQPPADAPTGPRSGPPGTPAAGAPPAVPAPRAPEADTAPDDHDEVADVAARAGTVAPKEDPDAGSTLTQRERDILAFERRWWRHAGAKEQAIRDTFDLSATRYYQLLNGLLDNPAALSADPVLVGRLRRLRSTRSRNRRR